MFDLITMFLLIVLLLKIVGIINAIRWMSKKGRNYVAQLKKVSPQSPEDYYNLFHQNNGGFFPFGFKDYLLRRYLLTLYSRPSYLILIRFPIKLFQKYLYRFERLSIIITVYCFLVAPLYKSGLIIPMLSHEISCLILFMLTIIFIFANLILSVEAIYSYGILGGYATTFHMISSEKSSWSGGSQFLLEISVLLGKLTTTLLAGASAFYVSHIYYGALTGKIATYSELSFKSALTIFLQSVYFSITTLLTIGYGDIQPSNGIGQLVSFLVQLQSFALLGLVLTSVSALASKGVTKY